MQVEELQIEDWTLQVDVQKTRAAYHSMAYRDEPIEWLNYIEACSFTDLDVIEFFERLGADILKPSHLNYHPVEGGALLMYTGFYRVYGDVLAGEIDGWDVVIGQYCFSLIGEHDTVPAQLDDQMIEIGFEVVLPWILDIPVKVE